MVFKNLVAVRPPFFLISQSNIMKLVLTNLDQYYIHRELMIKLLDYMGIIYDFEDNDGLDDFVIDLSQNIALTVYNTAQALKLLGAEFIIID